MKKINSKGFTLVELLAVIVIMGILMMVAIPSVTRTIENSRKDTFVDIAKSYANAARTQWTADGLMCNSPTGTVVSSATDDGNYFVLIDTKNSANYPVLVDQGGKSSWGNRDVQGYVRINVSTTDAVDECNDGNANDDDDGDGIDCEKSEPRRNTKFYVTLSDGTHGIIDSFDGTVSGSTFTVNEAGTQSDAIVRGNVKMTLTANEKAVVSGFFAATKEWKTISGVATGLAVNTCVES